MATTDHSDRSPSLPRRPEGGAHPLAMRVATPRGEVSIETLRVGDPVITRDHGLQVIRRIGRRVLGRAELRRRKWLAPIRFRKGSLGNDLPERDMMLSPNHRILVTRDQTALYFEQDDVVVAAKHLTGLKGVSVGELMAATYNCLMFDQHELILCNGIWAESFQPLQRSLDGGGNAQRLELRTLFPELRQAVGADMAARPRPKAYSLVKEHR